MTPRTQSKQGTAQNVKISVQVEHTELFSLMKLRSQNKSTHLFHVFIVYGHFELPIFGRHTKTWSWESNRKLSMIFHLVSCRSCDSNNSS